MTNPLTYDVSFEEKKSSSVQQDNCWGLFVNGKLIGIVSYYREHRASNWLEAGIAIYNYDYWDGGYGTTFLKAWIDHLFKSLPLVRVGFTTWSGNQRISYVDQWIPVIIKTIYSEKIPIEKSKSIKEG